MVPVEVGKEENAPKGLGLGLGLGVLGYIPVDKKNKKKLGLR